MRKKREVAFGELRLDYSSGRVWQGGNEVRLRPKAFAVLRYLAMHRGRLVSRDELLREVWPGTHVSDGVLRVCVREIRSALGDDSRAPRVIETVGKQGYRCRDEAGSGDDEIPRDRFVGRGRELDMLMGCLADVRKGAQKLVFVSGEAGIGKTELLNRFVERVEAEGAVHIGRGQCLEHYGEGEAYLPVLEALGELCRHPTKGTRVKEVLARHAPSWLVHMTGLLSDQEAESLSLRAQGTTHERSLRELGDAIEALSREEKVVLAFEDLHWSDHSTLELVHYLGRRPRRARLLWVGTYRPEEAGREPATLLDVKQELLAHGQGGELELSLLREDHVADYLTQRLDTPFEPELGALVHRRTEGNALFMVRLVDYLLSERLVTTSPSGWRIRADDAARVVPENLRQLIERQLDRFSESQREALEVASVAGVEFAVASVAGALAASPEAVERICLGLSQTGHMIAEREVQEWPNGTLTGRYGFTHAFYQEVLYQRLSKAHRIVLHQRIGKTLELAYGGRAAAISAELAVHFERGHDPAKAVHYLGLAANAAIQRSAHHEAIEHLGHSLELLSQLPAGPWRDQQELVIQATLGVQLSVTHGYAAPEVERAHARAHVLFQKAEPDLGIFTALCGLSGVCTAGGNYAPGLELGRKLQELAGLSDDPAFAIHAHLYRGLPLVYLGRSIEAQHEFESAGRLYDPQRHKGLLLEYGQDPSIACRAHLTWPRWLLGFPDDALWIALKAHRDAEELMHPFSRAWAIHFLSLIYEFRGDYPEAVEAAESAQRLSEEHRFAFWGAMAGMALAGGLIGHGEPDRAADLLRQGLVAYARTGAHTGATYWRCQLAKAYGALGQVDQALTAIDEAIRDAWARDERWWEPELHRQRGELLLMTEARGQAVPTQAVESLTLALQTAERQGAKSLELRAAISLVRLRRDGAFERDRGRLRTLYEGFSEGFETADLRQAESLLGA